METATPKQTITIQARVFRARKDKPKLMPTFLWSWAKRLRLPGTGRWENLGEVASNKLENIQTQ